MLENVKDKSFHPGDGAFVLSVDELKALNFSEKEKGIIKKYLNNNNVKKYRIDFKEEYLIYSDKKAK